MKKLGELLCDAGLLSQTQLDYALSLKQRSDQRLGDVLVELGYISHEILIVFLAKQLHLDCCVHGDDGQLAKYEACESSLSAEQSKYYQTVVLGKEGDKLVLGITDPCNYESIRDLLQEIKLPVKFILVTQSLYQERYQQLFAA